MSFPTGQTVRSWRRYRELRQNQLAALVGTTQSHISEIEHNATDVNIKTLEKIFNAMGLELIISVRPSERFLR